MNITQSPPKNLRNQIHWIQQTVTLVSSGVVSGSNVEANWSFKLNDLNQYAAMTALFDQFCLYSVVFNVCISGQLGSPLGSVVAFGRLTTAIDFDNVSNLGSEAALQQYATAQTVEIVPGLTVQRYIKPCVTPNIYLIAGTGYAVGRAWLDNSSTSVLIPHYGIRVYFVITGASGPVDYDIVATYTMGFRSVL